MRLDAEAIARAREAERSVREAYDRVPYPGHLQHQTHPDNLATLALLHGLEPAPPERCRVLELGCAGGGNLIPMALEMPGSRFVGLDLSPRQIDAGRAFAEELGLANLELRAQSLLDADASLGIFDYVICHGVFSWVAPTVQEKILAVCRENLAPGGVAYLSYNTLPGWHLRGMVRDMVLYHTRGVGEPEERTRRAFELVGFLAEVAGDEDDAHAVFLRTAREIFEEHRDRPSYLLHEYLEETNTPLYFHELAERAGRHGLQYLTEADPHLTEIGNLPSGVAEGLQRLATDRLALEQYLDFVLNRTFRRTLLCHAEVPIERGAPLERMERLHIASATRPVPQGGETAEIDLRPGHSATFRTEWNKTFTSSHPLAKAALTVLAAAWPRSLPFAILLAEVRERLAAVPAGGQVDAGGAQGGDLADLLGALYWSGVIDLHLLPPVCAAAGAFPRAAPFARRQALAGPLVTTQRRRTLKLDTMGRFLFPYLDGSRDRAALVRLLEREVTGGRLEIALGDGPVGPERLSSVLETLLDHHLRTMAGHALLVG